MKNEAEEMKLHRLAKVRDFLEMWQVWWENGSHHYKPRI
jgi:hypothetical protein